MNATENIEQKIITLNRKMKETFETKWEIEKENMQTNTNLLKDNTLFACL